MKENYSRPTITNADISEANSLAPWGVVAKAAATAVGYAVGRAVTNASRAMPSIKTPALQRSNHDI
ncbi:MAG: hypothetical protein IJP68_13410 [Selenomonadaceae bacterium]|nr:hypothetical protein [Selenomonadaceae bacterium]